MASGINDWSKTASNNASSDDNINWSEGQSAGSVNNSARAMMAELKKFVADISGEVETAGSGNTYTATSNSTRSALSNGQLICLKANHTNTGASTLNVDGRGAKKIVTFSGSAEAELTAGLLVDDGKYFFAYSEEADSATGAWILQNPTVGASLSNVVDDTTPQLGGMLDVNGQAIGDGTRELLSFTEDASAVNHVNIENEATGSGPIISAVGDDTNIDINLAAKGTGLVKIGGKRVALSGTLAKTTTYTIVVADEGKMINADASGAGFTLTLPTVATAGAGFSIGIKKTDSGSNAVTVDGNGAETIDGATTLALSAQYDVAWLVCDGTEWFISAKNIAGATSPTLDTIEALSLVEGDLLYATGADTITRLAKGTALYKLAMNAGATAPEWVEDGGGVFSESFESADQTITQAGALTIAHGLSAAPTLYVPFLKCTTAELGYSTGHEVNWPDQDSANRGLAIVPDSTNLNVRYGSALLQVSHFTTGILTAITASSWRLVIKAYV